MMICCSRSRSTSSRSRVVCPCPVALPLLLVVVLLLISPCSAELNAAVVVAATIRRPARRLLVSRPLTSRQKAEQQQKMGLGSRSTPFKQVAASFGKKNVPRSGWNPIQNR